MFDQLLDFWPKNIIFLLTFDSEFSYIEVWFTDQNSKLLEIEDKMNITLVIIWSVINKKSYAIQFNQYILTNIFAKSYFWLLQEVWAKI